MFRIKLFLFVLCAFWNSVNAGCKRKINTYSENKCLIDKLPNQVNGYKVKCVNVSLLNIPLCDKIHIAVNCSLVTELTLMYNHITVLGLNMFINFTNLKVLNIIGNPIERLENGTFKGLVKLETFVMQNVTPPMAFVLFPNQVFRELTSIKNITFINSFMHIPNLFASFHSLNVQTFDNIFLQFVHYNHHIVMFDENLTSCFANINITNVALEAIYIIWISPKALLNFKRVKYISVKGNQIAVDSRIPIMTAALHNLAFLDASCQGFKTCSDKYPWSDWLPGKPNPFREEKMEPDTCNILSEMILQNSRSEICFLPKLQSLFAHHTVLDIYFLDICWKNSHLVNVDLSFVRAIHLKTEFPCMKYLKYLNLRGIGYLKFPLLALKNMPSLEVLMFGSSHIVDPIFNQENASLMFKENKQLKFLDFSNLFLDKIHSQLFNNLSKLEVLILNNNRFTEIDISFESLTSLKYIDYSYNNLKDIPIKAIEKIQKHITHSGNISLRLDGNPFICICSSIDAMETLHDSRVIISNFSDINCTLMDKTNVSFKEALAKLQLKCRPVSKTSVAFITSVYPLVLFIIFVAAYCLRYRWKLQYIWHAKMQFFERNPLLHEDRHYMYDAFVAYAGQDSGWVRSKLIEELEFGEKHFKLCIHERDFIPGYFISDNIISAIRLSRKVIFVVSKQFIKSKWCDFESKVALSYHLGSTNGIIAIVFPGAHHYPARNMAMARFLDSVTYLEWSTDKDKELLFWLRLRRALT